MKRKILTGGWIALGLTLLILAVDRYLYPHPYTNEQCKEVAKNFTKLKIGMSKEEVIPLIGGKRKRSPTGKFPGHKNRVMVWALCKNPKNHREWLMIAFDTKTNRVVKIFSASPEEQGFE